MGRAKKMAGLPGVILAVMVAGSPLGAQIPHFDLPMRAKTPRRFTLSTSYPSFHERGRERKEKQRRPVSGFDSGSNVPLDLRSTRGFQALLPSEAARGAYAVDSPPMPGHAQTTTTRPKAIRYSDGYYLRLKIHKYASIATLPLFVAEAIVGQKLYDDRGSGSLRGAHSGLAAGIAILFGANSVTGVWNLWDARRDPNGRTRRLVHGLLMLTADAGFLATGALAPGDHEDRGAGTGSGRSTHRAVALTSMGIATAGYLYMLIAK